MQGLTLNFLMQALGTFWFFTIGLAFVAGVAVQVIGLTRPASKFRNWAVPVALLPLLIGLIGTADGYIGLYRWTAQLAENRQTMGADDRAEWIETAWFTTTVGGNLTLWLLGPAVTLFVFRKKDAPEPNVAAERQSGPTDAVSDPPPKEVVQRTPDTHVETCPHCRMKIMRKADGRCPSCHSALNGRQ